MTPDRIEEIWRAIEGEARPENGWHVRKISAGTAHDLLVGRRMPQGTIGLLYDLEAAAVSAGTEWPSSTGFRTDVSPLGHGPSGRIRVSLELTAGQYRDVFAALCGDIATVVLATHSSASACSAFVRRLHAWQKFMQLHAGKGLSAEKIRGLFAELHVIDTVLAPTFGHELAIAQWQGAHALHDFRNADQALEVKSGSASDDPTFAVSRLDQLDESLLGRLYLAFVPLSESASNGLSLPELVTSIRNELQTSPGALQRFDDLLVGNGYHPSQASLCAEPKLRAGEVQIFRVVDGFPRLQRHAVPDGVVSARYSVRLAECFPFLIAPEQFRAEFGGVQNGE